MCSEIWSEAVCTVTNVPEFSFTVILDKGEIQRLEPVIDFMASSFVDTHQKEMNIFTVLEEEESKGG